MAGNRLTNNLPSSATPFFNAYKNSLFAVVEKQYSSLKKSLIHRLVLIAKINLDLGDKVHDAVAGHYEQFILKSQRSDGIAGILLLNSDSVVHVVESTSSVLTSILNDVCEMEKSEKPLMKEAKVLVVSHCIQTRMFTSWSSKILTVTSRLPNSSSDTEPEELLSQIYKLCVSIQKHKECFSSVMTERAVLVTAEAVHHLCQSQDLLTPQQYLQMYKGPVDILLDSEVVWPTANRLYWETDER